MLLTFWHSYLLKEGYQYSSINSYHLAISSVHEKVEGHNVGQHPLVTRILKGVLHDSPPLPRYSGTWNVQTVLNYLEGLEGNKSLPLKTLRWKLTILRALINLPFKVSKPRFMPKNLQTRWSMFLSQCSCQAVQTRVSNS